MVELEFLRPHWNTREKYNLTQLVNMESHMTNTRITDVEIMEKRYPILIDEFSLRPDSGGSGEFNGGDGLVFQPNFVEVGGPYS